MICDECLGVFVSIFRSQSSGPRLLNECDCAKLDVECVSCESDGGERMAAFSCSTL